MTTGAADNDMTSDDQVGRDQYPAIANQPVYILPGLPMILIAKVAHRDPGTRINENFTTHGRSLL
jgi:hypothetical protein